ncbi:glycosyltransferase [Treponema phagedenis]|uniref:starch synthase n=1 Tax=Treponema phagedenis TaxID=162 RepID=A0A0B7GWN8_TREPH|nr:glycogen/starch synthase [Treponema phagedenis]NVP24805.1 glycogen/starch synthase [Treponema phagedenis]QKS93113.1 glycogen/starch synthase [Treponema phagedenis]QLC58990.1 glycogen/starch synthase [Treponema phagedenis]QSH98606.1 glycosyltransferase [Treponema phagedenis]CEM61972.1 Glycogen/starch synthase, ADP-glucose type [Treponema phagedenis]
MIHKKLWLVSREYAGIAEAGGVKNVVKSLATGCASLDLKVKVFLPQYACSPPLSTVPILETKIPIRDILHTVRYFSLTKKKVQFIFVDTEIFNTKQNVYTYSEEEAEHFNAHSSIKVKKGEGYLDTPEMNILFQKAVAFYAEFFNKTPDILHCHDAHTALLPAFIMTKKYLADSFANTKMIVTIHNAGDGYRQTHYDYEDFKKLTGFTDEILSCARAGEGIEPFLIAVKFAVLTTVSGQYAKELVNPALSDFSKKFSYALQEKNISVIGITNGIDYDHYDPMKKSVSLLPFTFNPEENNYEGKYKNRKFLLQTLADAEGKNIDKYEGIKCFGNFYPSNEQTIYFMYHGRVVKQKGIHILLKIIPQIVGKFPQTRFFIMGQGEAELEQLCMKATKDAQGHCIFFKGYNRSLARLVTAASDFTVLPSLFEPCGLEDFIGQIFATIPIAHAIGGLTKIEDKKTGFLYRIPIPNGKTISELSVDEKIFLHETVLRDTLIKIINTFPAANCCTVSEIPAYSAIIQNAIRQIKTKFSWKHIIQKSYFPLYGIERDS